MIKKKQIPVAGVPDGLLPRVCLKTMSGFLLMLALVIGMGVQQAQAATVHTVAQKALATNPEVQARWHEFLATLEEREVARAGFSPEVDLTARYGHERLRFRDNQRPDEGYNFQGAALNFSLMIYDGYATRSEVDSLSYHSRASFYSLMEASEETTLETFRAYEDVRRHRELVQLAEDNLRKHEEVAELIAERVNAGVGRSVDLEQVTGRVALANSNLVTETSNLHDVSARFRRIVGDAPPAELTPANLKWSSLPSTLDDGIYRANLNNPAYLASIEKIRAAQEEVKVRTASMKPRLDLVVSGELGEDIGRIYGDSSELVAQLVMSYNLFRGGADKAAIRQLSERKNVSMDIRDKLCRDMRQTLAIAFNDVQRIDQQLRYLYDHQQSIAKAREAYREQFDIGQRTLLDLLDSENEYFEARRAYANGLYDQSIAKARTLAAMGELMKVLEVRRDNARGLPKLPELGDSQGSDPSSVTCR